MGVVLNDRVISITEESYVPASIDGVLDSNVFYSRLFKRETKRWGGRQILVPLQFAKPTTGGTFAGAGNFDTAAQNTRVRQTFTHAQFYQNVTVVGGEASLNRTDGEVLDLIKLSLEEACNAMSDSMGDQMYGTGTGDDFNGLGLIVDDGTDTSSYAGLSRTTYPQLNSTLQAAAGGALSFDLMATLMRGASAASSKRQRPSVIVTGEQEWDFLESLFTPTINANYGAEHRGMITTYSKPGVTFKSQDALAGHFGFEVLVWRGIPVVADEKQDSGVMHFLNEEYLHWYNLPGVGLNNYKVSGKVDGVNSEFAKSYPIQWSGFDKPFNQYAQIGQFIMLGNLISGQTRRHAKATAITTV